GPGGEGGGAPARAGRAGGEGRRNSRRAPDARRQAAPPRVRRTENPAATSASRRRIPRGLQRRERDLGPCGARSFSGVVAAGIPGDLVFAKDVSKKAAGNPRGG